MSFKNENSNSELTVHIKKYARKCDFCGKGMNEGYVIGDCETACSDECLLFTEPTQDRYFTEWEDESEFQYISVDGVLHEIEDYEEQLKEN